MDSVGIINYSINQIDSEMKKRIRKKLEKKNEKLFGHIAVLSKYHCESCNMDFEIVGNKNILHIAKWFAPKCPICKNKLKKLEQ